MTTVYEKALNYAYTNKLDYPKKPSEPAVLRKPYSKLTADERATIATVDAEYQAALVAYREAQTAYRAEDARLYDLFRAELEEEFGTADNPKRDKLFSLAWQHGHSSGFTEVYNYYSEFVELVD